ncbi:uncharacterized protein B0I36DRAFT_360067 [Microdochium trichocladiopsis]|uniref:SH3 domain-containing protein n=1 Tax=Microdochium trichocladiopsis TaxID=1682393 RepID=A0A9P8Y9U4_9PEZI|nr:uncharacterized protein B0I36DRAFT_360067 [Microdochium trichocladiopsis]KAH7034553.1 hypothetical protein B0I36DRAFT_360067 [Microdochium trichocladiopsis]
MAIDAEDLVIQPFRELVERGKEAIANAGDAADEDPDQAKVMAKAAASVVKEGERALGRLQPLWEQQLEKYGDAFTEAIRDDSTIAEGRRVLEDLLYDFDDYTELDTFEAERYTQLQSASRSFARSAIETIKTMKIDAPVPRGLPQPLSTPITPTSPDPTQLTFPPLPPLPPLSPKSAASRPQTAYEATHASFHNHHNVPPLPAVRANGVTSMRSSRADGLTRNDTRMSHSSQGSARRASSRAGTNHHSSVQFEVAEAAHRVSPNLEVLGEEMHKIRLVQGGAQSPPPPPPPPPQQQQHLQGGVPPPLPVGSPWTIPRTTAWVTEQANSVEPPQARFRDSIPEDTIPGLAATNGHAKIRHPNNRYTSDSSRRASSVFDGPASPETTARRSSNTSHSNGDDFTTLDQNYQRHNIRSSSMVHLDARGEQVEARPGSRMDALAEHEEQPLPIQHPDPQSFDTGLMLAREDEGQSLSRSATPIWYSRKANCSIGPESSLYQQGGFCRGALAFRTDGLESGTKIVYDYLDKKSENQCISCEYRQDTARIQNDMRRAANANFITEGVIYRSRFLYKSHMSTNISTSTPFACVFCAQDGRTTREGDATVFRNKDQLFKHLARHPQPLPPVNGVTVLYGTVAKDHFDAADFDLHFPESAAVANSVVTDEQSEKLARLPTAVARKTHIEGYGPDNLESSILRFYAGARIIGIEFPEQYDGKWCRGWHDGLRGYFPSKIIELEPPTKSEVRLPGMNNDGVTLKARWKWTPKDAGAGWLVFDKGDVISNVSWTNQEQWCWSGITKNGKAGFFPQTHIKPESISAAISSGPSFSGSGAKSIKGGSKMKMFGLRRTTTVSSNNS